MTTIDSDDTTGVSKPVNTKLWAQQDPHYDHPAYEGQPRAYVIASMPRSGSHMLGHMLFGTGQLGSPLEYFHPNHLARWQSRLGQSSPTTTLRAIMARRTSPSGWFGLKTHWRQLSAVLDDQELMAALNPHEWIQIVRADKVAQATSLVIAQQTKAWISFHEARSEPVYDFEAITRSLKDFERQEAAWDRFFQARDVSPLVVVYEDMLADPAGTVSAICDRLDVPAPTSPPSPGTTKQATDINIEWRDRYLAESKRH